MKLVHQETSMVMKSSRRLPVLIATFFAVLAGAAFLGAAQAKYKPAAVISAGDLLPPENTFVTGVAVLDLSLDAAGAVSNVAVLQDLPPLTSMAKAAVESWHFKPAGAASGPQPSDLVAAFVLSPPLNFPPNPPFSSLLSKPGSGRGYILPGIVSVSYAQYPPNSVVSGSVVIQVTVGPDGSAEAWQTVRSLNPCTRVALAAARKWSFRAATLGGRPVTSNVVIDFLFQPPLATGMLTR